MSVGYTTSKDTLSRNTGLSNQGPNYGINSDIPVWSRPSDWLPLPEVGVDESKIVGLVHVANTDSQFLSLTASAKSTLGVVKNYVVDWGDGTIETYVSTGSTVNHVYDYASISSTVTSDGMKQVIVQIYPESPELGDYLTAASFNTKYTGTVPGTLSNYYTNGWVDVLVNCPGMTALTVGSGFPVSYMMKCRQFSLRKIGNISGNTLTFSGLVSLESIPEFNIQSNISFQNMFYGCSSLKVAPAMPWQYCTNAFQMFYGCRSLVYVPDATTPMSSSFVAPGSVTRYMFYQCSNLVRAPWIDTSKNINTQQMFSGCTSLQYVPDYDYSNCANTTSMFDSCTSLVNVPTFNQFGNVAVLNTSSMFANCYSLTSIPDIDLSNSTTVATMFSNCYSITSTPFYDIGNATSMNGFLQGCVSLTSIPTFNTSKSTNCSNMIPATALDIVPALDFSNATTLGSIFSSGGSAANNISAFNAYGMKVAFNVTGQRLSKNALETMFDNMQSGNTTSRAVTITSCYGADPVASTNLTAGQAVGSTTLTVASSAVFDVGDAVYNSVCFADVTVTVSNSSDNVTRNNHGLSNGTRISFPSLGTSSGFLAYTIYYVVNAATNTFQFSATPGGSPIDILATSTSTTLRYEVFVTGKPSSTTITISAPTTATTTATALTGRALNTYLATLKNWTITG